MEDSIPQVVNLAKSRDKKILVLITKIKTIVYTPTWSIYVALSKKKTINHLQNLCKR